MKVRNVVGIFAVACAAAMSGFGIDSDNIVGYQVQMIHQGSQEFTLPFRDLPTGRTYTVGMLLPSALEGDTIAFDGFVANAIIKDGALHWMSCDKILDDEPLPAAGSKIAYFRALDRETQLQVSGEAKMPQEIKAPLRPRTAEQSKVTTSAVEKPKRYLADVLSYSTVRICNITGTNSARFGTGFFFDFRLKKNPRMAIPAIVTNRHVAEGATNTVFTFTVEKGGLPSDRIINYRTVYNNRDEWIFHDDPSVDLAVFPILPTLNFLRDLHKIEVYRCPLTTELIPDATYFSGLTQMDDVCMIGYPNHIWDEKNNQPIFRKGVIATRPNRDYNGERCFLIDMAVYNGSSGSPILMVSEMPRYDRAAGCVSRTGPVKLLGVVYQTFLHQADGELVSCPIADVDRDDGDKFPRIRVPNNLGKVIHASRLQELEGQLQRRFEGGMR